MKKMKKKTKKTKKEEEIKKEKKQYTQTYSIQFLRRDCLCFKTKMTDFTLISKYMTGPIAQWVT